jgi:hypothetical protein
LIFKFNNQGFTTDYIRQAGINCSYHREFSITE